MCRSIKTLRRNEGRASKEDTHAAAVQFVRKVSGYRVPSRVNEKAFNTAVEEITAALVQLLKSLKTKRAGPAKLSPHLTA